MDNYIIIILFNPCVLVSSFPRHHQLPQPDQRFSIIGNQLCCIVVINHNPRA